jgi:hypothetical protein
MLLLFPGTLLGCTAELGGSDSVANVASPEDDSASGVPSGGSEAVGQAGGAESGSGGGTLGAGGGAEATGGASACDGTFSPGLSPLRRLTRFEYNNTLEALTEDQENLGNSLPPELLGNGYGNDADWQPVSSFLAEQYSLVAEKAGFETVSNPAVMAHYAPCYATRGAETEQSCARTFIESFGAAAYRRPMLEDEVEDLLDLQATIQDAEDFESSISAIVEAILQTPDYLYRLEFGQTDAEASDRIRPTGHEMAVRLSYFLWSGPPDDELLDAAKSGQLTTDLGVLEQAQRLIESPQARSMVRFFFDHFLPIGNLTDLARDQEQFPNFSPTIGSLMREETHTFLEREIFDGPGDWASALTAPYTFLNQPLAEYYGVTGVSGDDFQKVDLKSDHRLGLLTHGSVLTGTTVSNFTNPVRRGVFLLRNMMCQELPDPPEALANDIMPPEPTSGATGRERYSAHSSQTLCANCHKIMDPPGFALENYDAVGMWRDEENGVVIDASGELPMLPDPFTGPLELIHLIAASEETHACFAHNWMTFAYGRTLTEQDSCLEQEVAGIFAQSGRNVKDLLLSLTQTDAFLYLPQMENR